MQFVYAPGIYAEAQRKVKRMKDDGMRGISGEEAQERMAMQREYEMANLRKRMEEHGRASVATSVWGHMVHLHAFLKEAKPNGRSEESRRYAVTITEFEKCMAYFDLFVLREHMMDKG